MGLFDSFSIEGFKLKQPKEVSSYLKKNNAEIKEFQSKDLDSVMARYSIDSKGQIFGIQHKLTGKKVRWNNPFEKWRDNRSFLERMYNKVQTSKASRMIDETKEVQVKSKLNSTFNIYSYDNIAGRHVSLDYLITATNGKVTRAKLISWEIESELSAAKREKADAVWKARFDEEARVHAEFRSKWYYPILKETYNPFVFFSKKIIISICNRIMRATNFWSGI